MSESVIPAVLLRALSEYKFVGHPLWRMADGKDHVRVELTFHKMVPTLPVYKRRAKAGGSLHPLLASGLASPQLLDVHLLRPDRRLQHAKNRQHRRRRPHRQHYRQWRSTHQISSQLQDHQRQHSSCHFHTSRNQLHRLLLQRLHMPRDLEQSRRSTRLNSRYRFPC